MFDSARAKVARAQEHLDFMHLDFKRFEESQPYTLGQEFDPEAGKTFLVYTPSELPLGWPLVLGEFLYNCRCALDYVVFDLSGGIEGSAFPVFADAALFNQRYRKDGQPTRQSGLYKIQGITDARVRDRIEAMQPYHGGQPNDTALWMLHELNNVDKHRTLHLCRRVHNQVALHFSPPIHSDQSMRLDADFPRRVEKRTILGWWEGAPDPKPEVEASFTCRIAFDQGDPVGGRHVTVVCEMIIAEVSRVLAAIEAVFG